MRSAVLLAASLVACASTLAADELPKRKAGLWGIDVTVEGRKLPLRSIQQCTDAETDALMMTNFNGAGGAVCSQMQVANAGGTITVDSTCSLPGSSTVTHAVITGDFNSAYTVEVTSKHSPGMPIRQPAPDKETRMTLEAKWLGPCKEGQRAGDVILPGGIKLNVRSLGIQQGAPPR